MTTLITLNTEILRYWQESQEVHDKNFHRDIHDREPNKRLNHYAHHFSKYVGRFFEHGTTPGEAPCKTVTDTMLIALSNANALRLKLQHEIEDTLPRLPEDRIHAALGMPVGRFSNAVEKIDHAEENGTQLRDAARDIIRWVIMAADFYDLNLDDALRSRRAMIRDSQTHVGLCAIA